MAVAVWRRWPSKNDQLAALVGGSLGCSWWRARPRQRFPGSSFQYNLPPFRARFPNEGPRRAAFPVITV